MLKIDKIEIRGLFGRYSYSIPFAKDRVMILTGPNGFGKTTVLKFLRALWEMDTPFLVRTEFAVLQANYNDGTELIVNRTLIDEPIATENAGALRRWTELFSAEQMQQVRLSFSFRTKLDFDMKQERNFLLLTDPVVRHPVIPLAAIERVKLPMHLRWDPYNKRCYVKGSDGMEALTREEMIARYIDPRMHEYLNSPENELYWFDEWVHEMTTRLPVHMLDTCRTISESSAENRDGLTVKKLAESLKRQITQGHKRMSEVGSELAQSFPQRLMNIMKNEKRKFDELRNEKRIAVMRRKFDRMEKLQDRLCDAGLLNRVSAVRLPSDSLMLPEMLNVLSLYLADEKSRMEVFLEHLERIELLESIINEKLIGKKIRANIDEGLEVLDSKTGRPIPLAGLSSGEQHQIAMFFDLIFNVTPESLVLVDEPELSLHVAWQACFVQDIRRVAELRNFSALLATHSPSIIGNDWQSTIDLCDAAVEAHVAE